MATGRGALGGEPAGGGGGAAAQLQHPAAGDVAEQPRLGLPESLRAPDEVHLAEERAVFGLVVVGVAVPPAAGWPGGHRRRRRYGGSLRGRRSRPHARPPAHPAPVRCRCTGESQKCDRADNRAHTRRFSGFGSSRQSRSVGGLARCGNARGRLFDALADRAPRQGAGPRSAERLRTSSRDGNPVAEETYGSFGRRIRRRRQVTATQPAVTNHPTGATAHMTSSIEATSSATRVTHRRSRFRGSLPRRDRRDHQVLQRRRHCRRHRRQGRSGRGPARHRLQDRGCHPLARVVDQARRRPRRSGVGR